MRWRLSNTKLWRNLRLWWWALLLLLLLLWGVLSRGLLGLTRGTDAHIPKQT